MQHIVNIFSSASVNRAPGENGSGFHIPGLLGHRSLRLRYFEGFSRCARVQLQAVVPRRCREDLPFGPGAGAAAPFPAFVDPQRVGQGAALDRHAPVVGLPLRTFSPSWGQAPIRGTGSTLDPFAATGGCLSAVLHAMVITTLTLSSGWENDSWKAASALLRS